MSVSKHKREILKLARDVCPAATLETTRGTQLQITITGPGGSRKVFCALTPSDHRNAKNIRAEIRQAARMVGCIPER